MKKTYIVIASAILILFCLMYSVSYAYFSIKVNNDFNNGTSGNTTIGSDTVKDIIISDGTKVTSSNIIPGESVSSTFTVQNPNDISLCFGLDWINVVNEFVNKSDIVVSLQDENGTILLKEKEFPSENNVNLIEGLTIPANTTKTYILIVTYKNTDKDQSIDMNKKFQATLTGKLTKCIYTAIETVANLAKDANKYSNEVYTVPDKTSDSCTYTLAYDGTSDNNLRYVGANPCNYIKVDDEYWRIIGVMNNVDNGTGKKESRLKLIRAESIGGYSWDTSNSTINSGYGVNEWSQSTLMKLLNPGYENENIGGSLYYNSNSGKCYNSSNNSTKSCDFTSTGLKVNLKSFIDNMLWNTGSNGNKYTGSSNNGQSSHFYNYERSNDTGKICTSGSYCNDSIERQTTWIGKVGLIYPSDYGYATSGGSTSNRTSCLNKELYNWNDSSYVDCSKNNWLFNSQKTIWTITASSSQNDGCSIFGIESNGSVRASWAYYRNDGMQGSVFPVVYLKSSVSISSGEGTPENPYELSI